VIEGIRTVAVVGAGQMGHGIAHVAALAGYKVLLHDLDPDRLSTAVAEIGRNLDRQVKRDAITELDAKPALARIHRVTEIRSLAEADLVIESVVEDEDVKRNVFSELGPVLRPDCVLATNTSSIAITRLATSTIHPEKFLGLHFMNPVPMMELVEVIPGVATNAETVRVATTFVTSLGKTPAKAQDFPAFMVNRILAPMLNEAIYAFYEGVGTADAIDMAMTLGANHPMGPLELADFVGLDICLSNLKVLYESLADAKYRPCPLLVKYVEAGRLGRKSGRGFYDYATDPPTPLLVG